MYCNAQVYIVAISVIYYFHIPSSIQLLDYFLTYMTDSFERRFPYSVHHSMWWDAVAVGSARKERERRWFERKWESMENDDDEGRQVLFWVRSLGRLSVRIHSTLNWWVKLEFLIIPLVNLQGLLFWLSDEKLYNYKPLQYRHFFWSSYRFLEGKCRWLCNILHNLHLFWSLAKLKF